MVPLLIVTGESGSGKTTLIEGIIRNLVSRGYRVGVIKHSPRHQGLDEEGKDTWRFSRAGASITCLAGEKDIHIMKKFDASLPPEELLVNFPGMDLVLAEGYKGRRGEQTPVIEIVREGQGQRYSTKPAAVIREKACSGDFAPCFLRDDIDSIAAFIEKRIMQREESPHG